MERNVRPDEIPDGFSAADPTNNGGAGGGGDPQEAKNQEKEGQRKAILDQALTPEAFARLGTIKLVKPAKASAVEALITNMAIGGKLQARITEGKLIEMLEGIGAQQSKPSSINIQRKKYAFDSDDSDDDNDDDLL
eukprot:scaffold1139_cov235-Chaetoceros_neogracile.AAC.1